MTPIYLDCNAATPLEPKARNQAAAVVAAQRGIKTSSLVERLPPRLHNFQANG